VKGAARVCVRIMTSLEHPSRSCKNALANVIDLPCFLRVAHSLSFRGHVFHAQLHSFDYVTHSWAKHRGVRGTITKKAAAAIVQQLLLFTVNYIHFCMEVQQFKTLANFLHKLPGWVGGETQCVIA
jgi:hypothetical protein